MRVASTSGMLMDQNHREKSSPVFLLNCHKAGDWFKRINDRFYYFGKRWGSDREALDDDLLRRDGEKPEKPEQSECLLNIDYLVNAFLTPRECQIKVVSCPRKGGTITVVSAR